MTESVDTNDISSFEDVLSGVLDLLDYDEQQFIYLTGAAGTGKTTLIEKVLEENSLKKIVVAPTGVAALNIGGSTINSAEFMVLPPIFSAATPVGATTIFLRLFSSKTFSISVVLPVPAAPVR